MRIGIDASNLGGGGGITHLKEILISVSNQPIFLDIDEIVLFSSDKILNQIRDFGILTKITFPEFNKGILERVKFQMFGYDSEITKRCDILFSISGDYIGNFSPVVGMSRNMLLYERDIWWEIRKPKEIFRFWLNFLKQKRCFSNSSGIIFISNYAKEYANRVLSLSNKEQTVIYHGISSIFKGSVQPQKAIDFYTFQKPFNFLYVSTVHVYKNQWNVVKAISNLRKKGYPITLTLVGGVIFEPAGSLLMKIIAQEDPTSEFIAYKGHIPYEEISESYKNASGIIYASNCENMPNILIESMSSGVPIVCSDKSPMPEFLKGNGYYFNPKDVNSLENSIQKFLAEPSQRQFMAINNIDEVEKFSWDKTAEETFRFISNVYLKQN